MGGGGRLGAQSPPLTGSAPGLGAAQPWERDCLGASKHGCQGAELVVFIAVMPVRKNKVVYIKIAMYWVRLFLLHPQELCQLGLNSINEKRCRMREDHVTILFIPQFLAVRYLNHTFYGRHTDVSSVKTNKTCSGGVPEYLERPMCLNCTQLLI